MPRGAGRPPPQPLHSTEQRNVTKYNECRRVSHKWNTSAKTYSHIIYHYNTWHRVKLEVLTQMANFRKCFDIVIIIIIIPYIRYLRNMHGEGSAVCHMRTATGARASAFGNQIAILPPVPWEGMEGSAESGHIQIREYCINIWHWHHSHHSLFISPFISFLQ